MMVVMGYAIGEKLEETSYFTLYRARREGDTSVLVKVLRPEGACAAGVVRCKQQYEHIARIASPRIVAVRGVDERAGALLVVLEDFPGRDLTRTLATRPSRRMPVGEALDLAVALAEGLAAIHAEGLIHRDLRPQNVLISEGGAIKITGFGADAEISRAHELLYAPAAVSDVLPYLSPEQTGRMNRDVDYRTDLYSLGTILYQALTGRPPFEGVDPMELIHAHLAVAPAPPASLDPAIPEAVSSVVLKLLEKNAEDRYQSAKSLLADLHCCRESLRSGSWIVPFLPGKRDRAGLLQFHQKLYGREHDIEALTSSFERSLAGRREIVLVSGYSGIGKSSLVQEILKPLAQHRGYFTSGKHDPYQRAAPYSGFIQAFDGLVRQILAETEARIRAWRNALLEALGPNGQVICDVIPSLSHVIGPQPPVPPLSPLDAQNRLNRCFLQFVSVFARHEHPLVLFLDDLQWIDPASLGLLRALVTDDSLSALFFCGAYRDNEVSPAHPLLVALEELRRGGLSVREIVLAPLRRDHLLAMLDDALERDDTNPLAEVVLKKTGGNPFFVKRFIKSLHDHGVLTYTPNAGWRWDLTKIEALAYTENVVDLMVRTIGRWAAQTQEALQLGAALGSRFDLEVLTALLGCSFEEANSRLKRAVEEGLLIADRSGYRFAHDKVREGASAMIPEEDQAAYRLRVGRHLARHIDLSDGQNLFTVVGHLNAAGDLIAEDAERLRLAHMNFDAALRAEESAAFCAALHYLEQGLSRLPADAWTSNHALRLAYAKKTGLMLALCGRHDEGLAELDRCLEHTNARLDRAEVLRLKMNVQVLKNDLQAVLVEGLAALRGFGIDLPPFPDEATLDAQLRTTMEAIGEHSLEALPNLPPLVDPEIRALQDVLQELFAPCWFLRLNLLGVTVAKSLENTFRHGLSQHAIYGCINLGAFLCGRGDIELGYRFGHVARDLIRRSQDKQSEAMFCNMWGACVQHWREGYADCRETLLAGIHAGLEAGQYIWAFYNTIDVLTNSFLRGLPLPELLAEVKSFQRVRKLDQFNAVTWIADAVGQLAHNLSVETEHPTTLVGPFVDIHKVIEEARHIDNQASLFIANHYIVVLCVFQGAFEEAARVALRTNPALSGVESWHGNPSLHFYGGLALARASDGLSADERALFLESAAAYATKLSRWADLCPDNLAHRRALLLAEIERARGDARAAGDKYDEAIALAKRGGYLQDEALGNELAGLSFRSLGKTTIARAYLTEAHRVYHQWGATEAMRRLERSYPDLVPAEILRDAKGPGAASPAGAALDIGSVLKASQAISREIVLDRLLDALMCILVENAGARRGILLLMRDGRLVVEAEHRIGETSVQALGATPLESRKDLPAGLVTYVARTRETVVLDDPTIDAFFGRDPWLGNVRPRSALAAPIVCKDRVAGVIYLENDLARSAFTPHRVELIRMLSAQAAISIENARLYADLHQQNEERRRAEEAVRQSEELLHSIVDNAEAVIFAKDLAGRYVFINRGYEEFTHLRREEIIGKTDHELFPAENADLFCAHDAVVLQENRSMEFDEWAFDEGEPRAYLTIKFPLRDAAGKPYGLCGIATDVTARKRGEEVLRHSYSLLEATLEATADGILVVDNDLHVVSHNRRYAEIWSVPDDILATGSDDALVSFVCKQLLEPERFLKRVEDIYKSPEQNSFDSLPFIDGRVVERYSKPQRLGEQVVGRVWSFRDVTARVHAEQQRDRLLLDEQHARAAAEEAVHLRDDFLSIASHELRTPLTSLQLAIQSLGQRLARGMDVERVRAAVALSERQIKRLCGLIDMLLDVSRIQAGRLELNPTDVDLRELVDEVLTHLGDQIAQSGSTVAVRAKPKIIGRWDPNRLEQVVTNLLTNAIKFGKEQPIEIKLDIEERIARVSVRDHGIGIPADVQARLFERFHRGVSSRHYGGLGLGLYITRSIVEAHGGRIGVSSEVGQGSTFWVELPLSSEA